MLRTFLFISVLVFLISNEGGAQSRNSHSKVRGWDFLVNKLAEQGVSRAELLRAFGNKRMPYRPRVPFKLQPRESADIYRHFRERDDFLKMGRRFMQKYASAFRVARQRYGVEPGVIAAILLVETKYGGYTGKHSVFVRLARAASVSEPSNARWNWKQLRDEGETYTFAEVEARAKKVEAIFLPELVALFKIARLNRYNIFNIRGSKAGAFGLPQFLPRSYLRYGVDGNQDGRVSLFQPTDAILSVANYFKSHGWKAGLSRREQERVVWAYNKSQPYINTVLYLRSRFN